MTLGMALRAPVHIGMWSKSKWTTDLQEDWVEFQVKQQVDVVNRTLWVVQSRVFVFLLLGRVLMDVALGFDLRSLLCGSTASFLLSLKVVSHAADRLLRRSVRNHPHTTGTIVEMSILLSMLLVTLKLSLSMEPLLMQHRFFLTAQCYYVVLFSAVCYLPFWAHMCLGAPAIFMAWVVFHWNVDFCKMSVMIYGLIFVALFPATLAVWMEHAQWKQFLATRELDRERETLVVTQAKLQKEKESSESMCRELAIQRDESVTLLTQLRSEKQALEALLAMTSDASFWLSTDGDTVTRSDARFDAVMGTRMSQKSLLSQIPSSEHDRLRKAVCVEDASLASPVRLLTTSIKQGASVANVDLFIVDRCRSSMNYSSSLGYLVGLRLCQDSEAEGCPTVDPKVDLELAPSQICATKDSAQVHQKLQHMLGALEEDEEALQMEAMTDLKRRHVENDFGRFFLWARRRRHSLDTLSESSRSDSSVSRSQITSSQRRTKLRDHGKLSGEVKKEMPLRGDFSVPTDVNYLKECIKSMIEDLADTLNLKVYGCCHHHANLSTLIDFAQETLQTICKPQPVRFDMWQCSQCGALISAKESDVQCWICAAPKEQQ